MAGDVMMEATKVMAKRRKQGPTHEAGSRNVYADLGFADADEMLIKAQLVSKTSLASWAERLGLGPELKIGVGEERSGGRAKPSLLADAVEALIGALYSGHHLTERAGQTDGSRGEQGVEVQQGIAEQSAASRLRRGGAGRDRLGDCDQLASQQPTGGSKDRSAQNLATRNALPHETNPFVESLPGVNPAAACSDADARRAT